MCLASKEAGNPASSNVRIAPGWQPAGLSVASARHRTADAMMAAIPEAVVRELTVETWPS